MTAKETLLRTLFSDPNREHVNIKFFRGTSEVFSEDALCAQVNSAIFQLENGLVEPQTAMAESFRQADVRELTIPA